MVALYGFYLCPKNALLCYCKDHAVFYSPASLVLHSSSGYVFPSKQVLTASAYGYQVAKPESTAALRCFRSDRLGANTKPFQCLPADAHCAIRLYGALSETKPRLNLIGNTNQREICGECC